MAYKSFPRCRVYKFHDSDIWGNFFKKIKIFKGLPVFFARLRKRKTLRVIEVNPAKLRRRPQSLNGRHYLLKQRIKKFYFNLKENQIRRLMRNAIKVHRPLKKTFLSHLSDLFEARLDTFLLRTTLFPSPHFIRYFIRKGLCFVNQQKVCSPHYRLKLGDEVTFSENYTFLLKTLWALRLKLFRKSERRQKKILFPFYSYLGSFNSYSILKIKEFKFIFAGKGTGKAVFPFRSSLQRLAAYYKMLK